MISSSSFIIIILLLYYYFFVIIIIIYYYYNTHFLYIIDDRSVHCCKSDIALHSKSSEQRSSASANDQQAPLTSKVLGLIDF